MELLRRSLLVGCVLPGLWLMRLAPLDPLLSVEPVDFAAIRLAEAQRVPDEQKTEAQRRDAEIPLSVYIEEKLQYNVFPATGAEWGESSGASTRGTPPRRRRAPSTSDRTRSRCRRCSTSSAPAAG